jgi:hypothetical protein
MLNSINEKLLSKIIASGAAFTTIFLVSGSVTDPVNVTKLLALGVFSFAAIGVIFSNLASIKIRDFFPVLATVILFLTIALASVFSSDSPISQGIYGAYGRNNGFLAYLFLALLLLSAISLNSRESLTRIVKALLFAGIVNIAYCLWVIAFGDFIGWSNPYGNILGTFGNPNFIGSFLGIFIAAYLAYGLGGTGSKLFQYSTVVVIPITAYEIYSSNAIQGRVVGAAGLGIVGFFYVRSKFNSFVTWCYAAAGVVSGLFALLGALQIGPLTSMIYKTSVSLRGQYWLAGWNTGDSHPFLGVGMDAFGDWYRRSRDVHALELPGVNTVVNASHNVPIDMFAFGGWPLFIAYVLIMGFGGVALIRAILRTKKFDANLVVLTSSWVGYQLQSIISINQIGLAVWGWVLTGSAIAYEKMTREEPSLLADKTVKTRAKGGPSEQQAKPILFAAIFALAGIIVALPPFTADSKWRSAQLARTVQAVEESMQSGYFNPQNSMKYLTNIQTLDQSQMFEQAHTFALQAVKWNPESFELWKVLYLIKNSTPEEKLIALENMKRLDPLNPDVTSIE